jgi:hypothetical protein
MNDQGRLFREKHRVAGQPGFAQGIIEILFPSFTNLRVR